MEISSTREAISAESTHEIKTTEVIPAVLRSTILHTIGIRSDCDRGHISQAAHLVGRSVTAVTFFDLGVGATQSVTAVTLRKPKDFDPR